MDLPVDVDFEEAWNELRPVQKRYIMARQKTTTKASAARECGITPHTAYNFPDIVEELVVQVSNHRAMLTRDALQEASLEAVQTMVELLESSSDNVRARAAEYIIDQASGKATQHVKQETTQLNKIDVEIIEGAEE